MAISLPGVVRQTSLNDLSLEARFTVIARRGSAERPNCPISERRSAIENRLKWYDHHSIVLGLTQRRKRQCTAR
jgi:hypothetical protein